MGVALFDRTTRAIVFEVNYWHYRAIVETIRTLDVLPPETVDTLHESWCDHGLTAEEARRVASGLRARVIPTLSADERLLLDGTRTTEPDDGVFHREPADQARNYGTNRRVLEAFAACCETCDGFFVC